jgi:hypothetical protein
MLSTAKSTAMQTRFQDTSLLQAVELLSNAVQALDRVQTASAARDGDSAERLPCTAMLIH